MKIAGLHHFFKLMLQFTDPVADIPAVGLQLALAGTARADAAAETRQILAMS
ncbi:hypothetical protein D3C71_1783350 [compost metagenome]